MPSSNPGPPHLKPGSAVEISPDDDGFRGSWFVGTVIRRSSKKNPTKFLVEYKTLFKDEAGKKPLREILDASQLRPVQPEEKQQREFKFGDEVDAHHNDGWWEGTITEELGDGRFSVYFKASREQIGFGKESLRVHREWVDGCWKPSLEDEGKREGNDQNCEMREGNLEKTEEKGRLGVHGEGLDGCWKPPLEGKQEEKERQENNHNVGDRRGNEEKGDEKLCHSESSSMELLSGSEFNKFISELPTITDMKLDEEMTVEKFERGTLVEVTSNEEGFQGSWFSATIVEAVGKDKYLIEYTSLRTEDDSAFLREEIETQYIRPYPPNATVEGRFKEHQEVDAFYNDGWWVGVISKVLKRGSRYKVYFSGTKEEITFEHSDLRLHQDWVDGKWVITSQV